MGIQYGRVKDREEWMNPVILKRAVTRNAKKCSGTVMLPTTHDITPDNIEAAVAVIKKQLNMGNRLLIVSKPRLECIARLCDEFEEHKNRILFRLTIGSASVETLEHWEPGAPSLPERLESLKHAYNRGFETSVSCEPFLDDTVCDVIDTVLPLITDAVWVGKMNMANQRLAMNGYDLDDPENRKRYGIMNRASHDDEVMKLYNEFKGNEQVKWKDSIKKVTGVERPTKAGLDI